MFRVFFKGLWLIEGWTGSDYSGPVLFAFMRDLLYIVRMVIITATYQNGDTDKGEPTEIETAKEIIRIISGRFGVVYEIEHFT